MGTLGGVARSAHSMREFNLARCDNLATFPWNMVGGGNRQRRRIHEAVGPERTNSQTWSEKLDEAGGWPGGTPVATVAAESLDGSPFWTVAKSLAVVSEPYQGQVLAATAGQTWGLQVTVLAGTSTDMSAGIYATDGWGLNGNTHASVVCGPGVLTPTGSGAVFELSNLSATVPTVIEIYRVAPTDYAWMSPLLYPGGISSDTIGDSVKITRVQYAACASFGPYIKTLDAPVTTTDWPRRTLNGNGTTPQYGGGGWWSTDGTGDLLPSNIIGPSGYPMSKLARRSTAACYAYHASLSFIAGEKYARRIVVQAGDDLGSTLHVELATSGGNYIANGIVNVRTGAVVATYNGTIVLTARIGKQFVFELRGTAPATVTTGHCSWIVPDTGAVGTGHYVGCDQVEHGEVCTAHMHSGLGEYGSAITPPFGQLVTVDSGKPRFDYGTDGFGRGVRVEASTQNLLNKSENEINNGSVWSHYNYEPTSALTTAPDGSHTSRKFASTNTAAGVTHQCYQLGNVIAAPAIYSGSIYVKPDEIEWVVANLYDSTGDHRAWFHLPTLTVGQVPAGFTPFIERSAFGHIRIGLQGTLAVSVNAGFSTEITTGDGLIFSQIPYGEGAYLWGANFCPGVYGSYILGNSPTSPSAVESLETFDLQALDLHNGRGTILVDFIMPEVTSGNPHGIMSCANANFEWMGIYTSTTDVAVSCYSAGTRYQFTQGFSAGDRVRAALTFDTGYFASAVNGVPGPVTYGNDPLTYDRVIVGDLTGPRSYPADTTISLAATTGRVAITNDLCEATRI